MFHPPPPTLLTFFVDSITGSSPTHAPPQGIRGSQVTAQLPGIQAYVGAQGPMPRRRHVWEVQRSYGPGKPLDLSHVSVTSPLKELRSSGDVWSKQKQSEDKV